MKLLINSIILSAVLLTGQNVNANKEDTEKMERCSGPCEVDVHCGDGDVCSAVPVHAEELIKNGYDSIIANCPTENLFDHLCFDKSIIKKTGGGFGGKFRFYLVCN